MNRVVFVSPDRSFKDDLMARVDAYFRDRALSRKGDARLWMKAVLHLAAWAVLWCLLVLAPLPGWLALVLCAAFGMNMAFLGFNVGHDAIHGAYAERRWVNRLLAATFDLCGASSTTWAVAHNFVHHTYTNVPGVDHDLEPGPWMLFKPTARPAWVYRFQHLYAWALYGFTTLVWFLKKDFQQIFSADPRNGRRAPLADVLKVFAGKAMFAGVFVVLPLALVERPWWQITIGLLVAQYVAGVTLALVFQLAHCVEGTAFPAPDESNQIHDEWAAHQLRTTANFGGGNRLLGFLVGGLDHQVEHHLFPKVSHVHYRDLSPIVRQCAHEHGLPYLENPSVFSALASHARTLRRFGRPAQAIATDARQSFRRLTAVRAATTGAAPRRRWPPRGR